MRYSTNSNMNMRELSEKIGTKHLITTLRRFKLIGVKGYPTKKAKDLWRKLAMIKFLFIIQKG